MFDLFVFFINFANVKCLNLLAFSSILSNMISYKTKMKTIRNLLLSAVIAALALPASGADAAYPKHEHRAVWMTTVSNIDWPKTRGTSTTVAATQKAEAIAFLDALKGANFNCIYFQARPMADALYNSAYEPWSYYVSGKRGTAPAYDPLQFWIDESHARDMECFVWLNPYRYESSAGSNNHSLDYRNTHPDWVMEYDGKTIINPGMPEVRQRIADIVEDIFTKYDIDGVVFDDYFYLSGTPMSYDSDLYNAYKASGGTMTQANWRRDNVNRMVELVNNTIKAKKPWVKFYIGPAGAGHAPAANYGLNRPDCSASDWQYNSIYSEPLAWLYEGTIDAISPQLYWHTTHSTNGFEPLTSWWSYAAGTFGRHNYPSQSVTCIGSNPGASEYNEHITQVQLSRKYAPEDEAGQVYFSTRNVTGNDFINQLKARVYQRPALQPAITWRMPVVDPGTVQNLAFNGTTLSWDGFENYRYAVYAVPEGTPQTVDLTAEYLIGNPFSTSFVVPDEYQSGYQFAVSAVDRCGNEFQAIFLGESDPTPRLNPAILEAPVSGARVNIDEPFLFKWQAVADNVFYRVQVSTSSTFSTILASRRTKNLQVESTSFPLDYSTTYYWRVISELEGYISSTSAVSSFTTQKKAPQPIDPTNLQKDPATYGVVDGFSITSLWIYCQKTNNFHDQLGRDQRSFTYKDGKLYFSERAEGSGQIIVLDAATGQHLDTIELSGDYLTSSSGGNLGYPCNDIFTDAAGNICVSNMFIRANDSNQMTVCVVDLETGNTTRVMESQLPTIQMRMDYTMALGDVTQPGAVLYSGTSNKGSYYTDRIYRWVRQSNGSWEQSYLTVNSWYPWAEDNGIAPRVWPVDENRVVLDGGSSYPALYNMSKTDPVSSFTSNTAIAPKAKFCNGVCAANLHGQPIFIYSYSDHETGGHQFAIARNPNDFDFSKMTKMWIVPEGMLGEAENIYASNKPVAVNNSDGSVTLFLYSPSNGIAAYKIDKYEGVDALDNDDFAVKVTGNVAHASLPADFYVYNAAGILVKTAKMSSEVDMSELKRGVYVLSAKCNGKSVVTKISIL